MSTPNVTKPTGRPPKFGKAMTGAERQRYYRERKAALAEADAAVVARREREVIRPMPVDDEVGALAAWSSTSLVVPPGHPLAGDPLTLPEFGQAFLRDALTARESALVVARKNAKSAIVAVLALGYLCGPLRRPGWRGAVVSLNKGKAAELKEQARAIAEASGLEGLTFRRSPAPGRVESEAGGSLDVLAADASAGHASGFDLVVIDETGLLAERDRALINGLRSSVSARNGRLIHLSILGSGPFLPELIELRDDPAICVHLWQAPADAALTDESAWRAANPGLGTIKAVSYMCDRARLATRNPNDSADFRAHDLNLPGAPAREMVCTPDDWQRVVYAGDPDEAPARRGPCVVGLDAGGSVSMTAAAVAWPLTGRVEVYGAFPADPDLRERGRDDAVGRRYERLHERGELRTYAGRTTPVVEFLRDVAADLQGNHVEALAADRFRRADVEQALQDAGLRWPLLWRGTGASATADGSADVRSFTRVVLERSISVVIGAGLMVHAIAESEVRRDPSGNPALDKSRQRGRIDPLQAAVIATGLCERWRAAHRGRGRRRPAVVLAG